MAAAETEAEHETSEEENEVDWKLAGAKRLLFSSFQLFRLLRFFFLLLRLELEHGRSSFGPISLNSRGVHEGLRNGQEEWSREVRRK